MNYEIRISGSGTNENLAASLRQIADDVAQGNHINSIESYGKCHWEDPELYTEIEECDDDED